MATRTFTDERRITWTVWAVVPAMAERRSGTRRRVVDLEAEERAEFERQGRERRSGGERRRRIMGPEPRVKISSHLTLGWLPFESREERRRLAPVPPEWETASDAELAAMCARATVASVRGGRLIE